MSAHDTPEVGSGETVGEREWCGDRRAHSAPHQHRLPAYTGDWKWCDGAPDADPLPASPDPVRPADAGEGLSEGEREVLWASMRRIRVEDGSPVSILKEADRTHALWVVAPTVERILAAREAAWAEKYAAVVGERCSSYEGCDRVAHVETLHGRVLVDLADMTARAESAEAALATALREKAEDRARVEAVEAAYANTTWWHTGGTPCIPKHILRAALAIPTATGDE